MSVPNLLTRGSLPKFTQPNSNIARPRICSTASTAGWTVAGRVGPEGDQCGQRLGGRGRRGRSKSPQGCEAGTRNGVGGQQVNSAETLEHLDACLRKRLQQEGRPF